MPVLPSVRRAFGICQKGVRGARYFPAADIENPPLPKTGSVADYER
jgi:hypothetical protein